MLFSPGAIIITFANANAEPMKAEKKKAKWYGYLFRENIFGVGVQATIFAAGVVFTIVLPKLLGKDGFGYLSIAMGIVTLSSMVADLGLQFTALKFIPEGAKKGIAWKYFRAMLAWKLVLSFAAAVLLFLGADFVASVYGLPALAGGTRLGALYLFVYSLYTFVDCVFVGMKKAKNSFLMNVCYNAGRVILPIGIFFAFRQDYIGALAGVTAACGLAVMPGLFAALRDPLFRKEKDGKMDMPALKEYSFYAFVNYVALTTQQWTDTLLIGIFRPVSDVAVYRVAWLWATATFFLSPFSSRVFASAHAYEDDERSRKIFDMSLKYGFVFVFLMITGIMLVSEQFLVLIYGADSGFGAAYPVLAILSLLALETSLTNLNASLLWGKGNIKAPTLLTAGAAVCQILALLALIPPYGIIGAAVAVVVVRVAGVFVQTLLALKHANMKIPYGYVCGPVFCGLVTIAVLIPLKAYTFSWSMAVAYGVGCVAIYCLLAIAIRAVDVRGLIGIVRGAISR